MGSSDTFTEITMDLNFDNVESIKRVADTGGDRIEFHFKNGAQLWVCPDNDGVHYMPPKAGSDDQVIGLLVDMGSGHHTGSAERATLRVQGMSFDTFRINEDGTSSCHG